MMPEETANFVRNVPTCHRCPKRRGGICTADGKGETISAKAAAHACPLNLFPSRGLGDTVAKVLGATGVGAVAKAVIEGVTGKPCGCDKRQEALNRAAPYK